MTNPLSDSHAVLWRCVSRFHDWADRKFPQRIMREAASAGITGLPEWRELKPEGPREAVQVADAASIGAELFEGVADDAPHVYLRTGGSTPHPWVLSLALSSYDHEAGRVNGYNIISITFPRAAFDTPRRSAVLLDCFTRTHSPADTEFAAMHPAARWERLRTSLYDVAVTYDPMFAGVFWANFLGPGHVEQFDRDALRDLKAYRVEWVGTRGLFVVVAPDINDADTPAVEQEMQRLTEIFRRAHTHNVPS
ncbi:MAG TPA: hypothetical protein VNA19_02635 [Pyrinomonadaceae bacterium]|jgi:hypothetical protein|nr:hypothetical protein [Pyrinomonadaceae bacterium]